MMSVAPRCPVCGGERPARSLDGLCPRCLLTNALAGDVESDETAGSVATSPHPTAGASVLATIAVTLGRQAVPPILLRDTEPVTGPGPVVKPSSPEMPE